MKKYLFIILLSFLLNSFSLAEHQNELYEPHGWYNHQNNILKAEDRIIEVAQF